MTRVRCYREEDGSLTLKLSDGVDCATVETTIDDLPFEEQENDGPPPPPPCSTLGPDGVRCSYMSTGYDPVTHLPICDDCRCNAMMASLIHRLVREAVPSRRRLKIAYHSQIFNVRRVEDRWAVSVAPTDDEARSVCIIDSMANALSWRTATVLHEVLTAAIARNIGGR